MQIPEQGNGLVVLMQDERGYLQLRDNLSRFWCACGMPAVHYNERALPQYKFCCSKCDS